MGVTAEKRRKFDAEFREGAVRIVTETGKTIAEVAEDLGISLSYLPSVGLSRSFVRSADPGVLGMAVSLSPLDGSKNLAAQSPATTRPLIGIRDSIAV
ncbi:transposase [Streptomyces europaeiscabiei]|uniref:transposase n=1 Tax=Streptomyces europaeiscabiei TaxID=146819 RepID=UPI002E2C2700|nr:transposase [Streptomyces europaeiscabiei]